jgi:putative ABC transport system permease protein
MAAYVNSMGEVVARSLGQHGFALVLLGIFAGLAVILAGVTIAFIAVITFSRLLSSLLYQKSPGDPLPIAFGSVLSAAIVFGPALSPARRGTRFDPKIASRDE